MTYKQKSSRENPAKMSIMIQAYKGRGGTKGSPGSEVKGNHMKVSVLWLTFLAKTSFSLA